MSPETPMHGLDEAIRNARVLICAGTGGVGKTTVSAALALRAARAGRRTLVLTIDPARRLADAMGLEGIGSEAAPVALGGDAEDLPLEALMLDPKPTFDGLVERLAPDAASRARVLDNKIYRHLSEALAGSAEYAALEQVRAAVESERYDLVVVDTPPASHALDFLSAPRRLRDFLEGRFVKTLLRPAMSASRFGFRVFGKSLQRMMGLIERIAGVGFLDDLTEFLSAVSGLTEGFQAGTARVEEILLGEDTRFVLVGGARSGTEPGTLEFLEALDAEGARLAAVVLNRIAPWPEGLDPDAVEHADVTADLERLAHALAKAGADAPAEDAAILESIVSEAAHARRDLLETRRQLALRVEGREVDFHEIAERSSEIDGLEGLIRIGDELVGAAA